MGLGLNHLKEYQKNIRQSRS